MYSIAGGFLYLIFARRLVLAGNRSFVYPFSLHVLGNFGLGYFSQLVFTNGKAGTRQACLLYWMTDVGGTLIVSLFLVLPLYLARTDLGMSLAFSGDVGMSGGGFGSLGG